MKDFGSCLAGEIFDHSRWTLPNLIMVLGRNVDPEILSRSEPAVPKLQTHLKSESRARAKACFYSLVQKLVESREMNIEH